MLWKREKQKSRVRKPGTSVVPSRSYGWPVGSAILAPPVYRYQKRITRASLRLSGRRSLGTGVPPFGNEPVVLGLDPGQLGNGPVPGDLQVG